MSNIPEGIFAPNHHSWSAYNAAQMEEKVLFLRILDDLCAFIPEEDYVKVGRPSAGLQRMTFACVSKVYEQLSSRRATGDLEIARDEGYLREVPHFNTVLKYFGKEELTPVLFDLIKLSSLPLAPFEETFAIDGSGLSSALYSRWLDYRFHQSQVKNWLKIHVCVGTRTQIVTAITVTDGHASDSPQFPILLRATAENFTVKRVCADLAYSGRSNIEAAAAINAVPYIPFKRNATGRAGRSALWHKMFYFFKYHQDEFMEYYHQRSLVETTFSALKRKFQGRLFMKKELAQTNEALAKVLCHNICVLIAEMHQTGLILELEKHAQKINFCTQIPKPSPNPA